MGKKLTKELFVERSVKIHGDQYSYEKALYINGGTKTTITCKKHGDFSNKAK